MDKRSKIALYAIAAIIVLLMVAEITKPKAVNWRDSYSAADKIPLGCYVLFNELKNTSGFDVETSNKSIYESLKHVDSFTKKNLFLINDYISIEDEGTLSLLDFVERGNTVFISSNYFYGKLADTLNLNFDQDYDGFLKSPSYSTFTSPSLKSHNVLFEDVIENYFVTSIDTLNTVVLGHVLNEDKTKQEINFIKVPFGDHDGAFYLHTNPFAFTNYHLLDDKECYAAAVLSYLPDNPIIWDNYYKSGRKVITSPLRFILTNQALKWAFYIALLSLILFILFKGKRTQRVIPVIDPLKNSTVEFTKTVGDLYYQHGDFTNIINKKITYFLEHVRSSYYLDTNELSERFIEKLAIKSSNNKTDTKALVDFIAYLKSKSAHTENDLIELHKKIEEFLKRH
ncbi:DUF4350 domain-containing protein [Hanstruepera marina]|uniref:DUF4350 domain-containing protein n=1 Tax=Hanstruepera marina TaxID=2873265 RepID=UPI001CA77FA3|nr:DUF4350 domain-containing protein [Hanstruepera marina]